MVNSTWIRRLLGVSFLFLACGIPASTSAVNKGGEYAELYRRILWMDKEAKRPMFIPEKLLNEKSLDELPLAAGDRESIRLVIEERPRRIAEQNQKFPTRQAPICMRSHLEWGEAGSHPPIDFDEMIATNEMTILGRVVAVVPGWSVWGSRVDTIAYVKVLEVFRDEKKELRPSEIVAFRQQHGEMKIKGQLVCTEGPAGYYSVAKGDEVIVSGSRWQADPHLFFSEVYFPVANGLASSQAFTPIEKTRPITLDELRGAAKYLRNKKP